MKNPIHHAISYAADGTITALAEGPKRFYSKRKLKRMVRWDDTVKIVIRAGAVPEMAQ